VSKHGSPFRSAQPAHILEAFETIESIQVVSQIAGIPHGSF